MKNLLTKISQEEKNRILEMHSGGMKVMTENFNKLLSSKLGDVKPLNEQSSGFDVPSLVINAISKIEGKYSYMSNGVVKGNKYTGSESLGVMKRYINDTIGSDCWNNMSDKLKSQIYSFCFQADSSIPYKMKFIAGLANAIDPKISRGSIVNKGINDSNVQTAIKLIRDNCSNINSYYDNYLKVIDDQYKSMDYNNNYKYIWQYRPIAIDRIIGGADIDTVLSDWGKFIIGGPTTNETKPKEKEKPQTKDNEVMKKFVVSTTKLDDLNGLFKDEVSKYIVSNGNSNYDVDYFDVSSEDGKTITAKLDIIPNKDGYNRFSVLLNKENEPKESLNNSLSKNPGSKLIKDGTITINNKNYEYHLIGIHI